MQSGMCPLKRSAWAQSLIELSLCCPSKDTVGHLQPVESTAKSDQTGKMVRLYNLSFCWMHMQLYCLCQEVAHVL